MTSTQDLNDWVGRNMQAQDTLRPQPVQFMQATPDRNQSFGDGDALPPLWHWLYFLEAKRASELGRDAPPPEGAGSCRPWPCRAACGVGAGSRSMRP